MRLILRIGAVILVGGMVIEPAMAQSAVVMAASSDLSLVGMGLFGLVLGQRGGRKPAAA